MDRTHPLLGCSLLQEQVPFCLVGGGVSKDEIANMTGISEKKANCGTWGRDGDEKAVERQEEACV